MAERAVRCGVLQVPENRIEQTGRTIPIRVAVLPAALPSARRADPVVYFAGGPGGSAITSLPSEVQELALLHARHDFIFVDQRGTGSSNPLRCRAFPSLGDAKVLRRAVSTCLASLHADLAYYTTAMAIDDVADVLRALHIARADLVGGSYGATAAQVFLLRHPALVRTMTLIGGTLLPLPIYERMPSAAQSALAAVFGRCTHERACQRAFPHLAADWARLQAWAATSPRVVLRAPGTAAASMRFDTATLADAVHQVLISASTAARLPLLVHLIASAKDPAAEVAKVASALASEPSAPSSMITYPIRCGEPWAADRPSQLSGTTSFEYGSDQESARWWRAVCALMPRPPEGTIYGALGRSDVPVLMFNGSADPQDPPANMTGARRYWPESRLLVMPGQSHRLDLPTWHAMRRIAPGALRQPRGCDPPRRKLPAAPRAAAL
ncbi:MAG: alpha/beta hydrolase [Actinomycetota bacterium]|nr:alpha/beta hydrolase [Actinomycetota bacterium]